MAEPNDLTYDDAKEFFISTYSHENPVTRDDTTHEHK